MIRFTKARPRKPAVVPTVKAKGGKEGAMLKRLRSFLDNEEPQTVQWLVSLWGAQGNAVTYKELKEAILSGDITPDQLDAWQKSYGEFVTAKLAPQWEKAMSAAAVEVTSQYPDFLYDPAVAGATEYARRHGAELVTALAAEQRDALRAMITQATGYEAMTADELARIMRPAIGLTVPQAKANLNYWAAAWDAGVEAGLSEKAATKRADQMAATYAAKQHRYRAQNIARTELAAAYNRGHYDATRDAQAQGYIGDCKKTWLTADDERVCEHCGGVDGESVNMEDTFSNGVKLPPAHPSCRCSVIYEEIAEPMGGVIQTEEQAVQNAGNGLSADERAVLIDNVVNSEAFSVFDDAHKQLILADLQNASDDHLQIVQRSADLAHINIDGYGTCHYRPGTRSISLNMKDEPSENIRTLWHEYGHYVDDVRVGNGLTLTTDAFPGDSYTFDVFGASNRAEFLHHYNTDVANADLQGFLDRMIPGKYEVRGESHAGVYLKGTNTQVGADWGANRTDYNTLMDEISDGLKRELGAHASQEYLSNLGIPVRPVYSEYWSEYRTPKRQQLKTKPAYKGAEDAWDKANREYYDALSVWEAANPNAYHESEKLYRVYLDKQERVKPITDLLDGEASGEMGMYVLWGGHNPTYFKTNSLNINEGWANWFQLTLQKDTEMLEYLERYAPAANRAFAESFMEMVKQTTGR